MWTFIDSPPAAVQFLLLVTGVLMGLSHILRPAIWVDFFTALHAQGHRGVVMKIFALELWPALLIVTLHQVWTGPALPVTIYGWLLLTKCVIGLLFPELGLRSLAMSARGNAAFVGAGFILLALAALAGAALWIG
jgi:hypothetical protein